jgi:hypothetical protein
MENSIVYIGKNILQSQSDILTPMAVYSVYQRIREDQDLKEETQRLRKIAMVDQKAYTRVKTRLPFICCARFRNGIRNSMNFEAIQSFILDLDRIGTPEVLASIRDMMVKDPAVKLCYLSPGGKGLKLLFDLKEPCDSLKKFTDFYKTFSFRFAELYRLQDFVDFSTCDATRVSFLGHDPDVWYNSINEPVDMAVYLPVELELESSSATGKPVAEEGKKTKSELDESVYQDIRRKLNPKSRLYRREKHIFVPDILNRLIDPVTAGAVRIGLQVREVRDIHYGKKFVFTLGGAFGEVNLFYGSRGFSVVRTPKSGSDPGLAEIGEMLIRQVLSEVNLNEPVAARQHYNLN